MLQPPSRCPFTIPFGPSEARGSVTGYSAQLLTIRDPWTGPYSDRQTDRRAPGKVGWFLFLEGPVRVAKRTQSRALQLVVGSFCPSLPTQSLGPPPTPQAPVGGGVWLPLAILEELDRLRRGEEGEPWAWPQPESKGSCLGGKAGLGL